MKLDLGVPREQGRSWRHKLEIPLWWHAHDALAADGLRLRLVRQHFNITRQSIDLRRVYEAITGR
jgi:hypothetical protein